MKVLKQLWRSLFCSRRSSSRAAMPVSRQRTTAPIPSLLLPVDAARLSQSHRDFGSRHKPERREKSFTAKEKVGKRQALVRKLDMFKKKEAEAADRLNTAMDDNRAGNPYPRGTQLFLEVKENRARNVAMRRMELERMIAKKSEFEAKISEFDRKFGK